MEVWPGHQLTGDSNSPLPMYRIQIHVDKIIHPTNKTNMLCHVLPFWYSCYSYPNPKTLHPQCTDLRRTEVVENPSRSHGRSPSHAPRNDTGKRSISSITRLAAIWNSKLSLSWHVEQMCAIKSVCAFLHCKMFVCVYIYIYIDRHIYL